MTVLIQPTEGEELYYIVDGALMQCSKGACPCKIKAMSKCLTFKNKDACTTLDNNEQANMFNFGICAVTKKTCTSCIKLAEWLDFKKDVSVDDKKILTHKSNIKCAIGGKITFLNSGQ